MKVILFVLLMLMKTCEAFPYESKLSDDEMEDYFSLSPADNGMVPDHQIIYIEHVTDKATHHVTRDMIVEEKSSLKFRAFDEDFFVDVTEKSDIFVDETPTCNIINSAGEVIREPISTSCFHHGNVRGHKDSFVGVSTCNGLTASITRFGYVDLYIEPLTDAHAMKRGIHKGLGHIAYRNAQQQPFTCIVEDDGQEYGPVPDNVNAMYTIPKMYLKVHLVAEHDFYAVRGADSCRCLISTFIATAHRLELLPNLNVLLNGIDIITSQSVLDTNRDSSHNLRVLKDWMKLQPQIADWDHVALIVPRHMDVAGRAYVCSVCSNNYKRSVSYIGALYGTQTLAHEIGHNLCISHNSDTRGCMGGGNTMGYAAYIEREQGWAKCSIDQFKSRIIDKDCLSDM